MPTTVVKTIGVGGDYTTLQAWEDASPADLVAADQIWQGQIKNATDLFVITSGVALLISGETVDSTRYVELTTAAGASFRDNVNAQTHALHYNSANGCAIQQTTNFSIVIQVSTAFTRLSNLQIIGSSASGTTCQPLHLGADSVTVDSCIVDANYSGDAACYAFSAGGQIKNCLIVQRAGGAGCYIVRTSSGASYVNCTLVAPSDTSVKPANAIAGAFGAPTVANCAIFGTTALTDATNTPTYVSCYTDIASPPAGFTQVAYAAAGFVNTTTSAHDFRLAAGSVLIDQGTVSAAAPTDIVATARPQGAAYDVGCWEFVAAAAAVALLGQACL